MGTYKVEDFIPAFHLFWQTWSYTPINVQIEQWANQYSVKFPELYEKLTASYQTEGMDWREIAQTHVFPLFPQAVDHFDAIGTQLKQIIPWVYDRLIPVFNVDFDICFLFYVGIGVGAGWATTYKQIPAVLFGIENVVECGWLDKESLQALTAHEVGHLVHQYWRRSHHLPVEYLNPFWQLYEEGFAMRCEHKIMTFDSWHESGVHENWTSSCETHIRSLARHFLNAADNREEMRRFFGSWYEIDGLSQTGYFLGHEIIRLWEQTQSLYEIAVMELPDIIINVKETLLKIVDIIPV